MVAFAGAASAREIAVSDEAGLRRALASATAGDRIGLRSGDYGDLVVSGRRFAEPVVIAAKAPGAARFRSITLADAGGLHFHGIIVAGGAVADPKSAATTRLDRVSDVAFENVEFHGAEDGRAENDPNAIIARDCSGLHISNARFRDLWRGAAIFDCEDWSVRDSEFRRMASDGIVARGAVGAAIEGNLFADFATDLATGVHPDAIQVWDRLARRATRGLVVRGNAVLRGSGGPAQGIFLFGADPALVAENVLVEDNLVIQSMGVGIGVRNVAGAVIRRNTVVPADPERDRPGIEARAPAAGVVIEGNAALVLRTGPAAARGNVAVDYDHPDAEGYVERLFADPRSEAPEGYAPLTDAGAERPAPRFLAAGAEAIASAADPFDPQRHVFRIAGGDRAAAWRIKPPGADAFEDAGNSARLDRTFAAPGLAVVEARWRDESGETSARKSVHVFPRSLYSGAFSELPRGEGGFASLRADGRWSGMAILDLMIEAAAGEGARALEDLVVVPGAYRLRLSKSQAFATLVAASGARVQLSARLPEAGPTAMRVIRLTYDGVSGRAALAIDGAIVATAAIAKEPLAAFRAAPLHIGGAPRGLTFSGAIGRIDIARSITPTSSASSSGG